VILTALANFLVTIVLAVLMRSYWAIVLGNLAGAAVQVVLTWLLQSWRPRARMSIRGAAGMLRFGGSVAGFDMLNFFARNADNVLIGRYWGAGALGFYERSYALMMAPLQLINGPLARVMLPLLSRLRDEPERYRNAFLSSLRGLLLATTPAAALAVATSDQLVPLLLGRQWAPASPIFFWLAIGCLYQPLGGAMGVLFTSTGRGRVLLQWALLSSATIVLSFAIGLPWGAAGVAKAYVLVGLINVPVLVSMATRATAVRSLDVYGLLLPYAAAALVTIAILRAMAGLLHPVALVALGLPLAYAVTIACVWFSPGGRDFLETAFRVGASMLFGGRRERS
jgi:polysaccharide transporter, PST family